MKENPSHVTRTVGSRQKSKSNLEKMRTHGGSRESLIQEDDVTKAEKARQQIRARFQVLLTAENGQDSHQEVTAKKKKQRTKTTDSAIADLRPKTTVGAKKTRSAENLLNPHMYQEEPRVKGKQTRKKTTRSKDANPNLSEYDGDIQLKTIRKGGSRGRPLNSKNQNIEETQLNDPPESTKISEDGKENQAYDESPDRLASAVLQPGQGENKPKKKKAKKKAVAESLSDKIVRALETKKRDDAQLFAIEVHKADRLKPDIHISHPLVRIHVIDANTGQYVKKSQRDRNVTSYYETKNELVDYMMPLMTQPYDYKKLRSLTPAWDELLIYNEIYSYLLQREPDDPKAIIVFELLDFLSMPAVTRKENASHGKGWYKIAWAFLKIVGADGSLNTDRKVRLQLYSIPQRIKTRNTIPNAIEPFQWWSSGDRCTYPSTLYITVKGLRPPSDVAPSTRSMFPVQEEKGTLTYEEFSSGLDRLGARPEDEDIKSKASVIWNRLPGQINRIPNKITLSLPSGRRGCSIARFSNNGRFLACACTTVDSYPVIVYQIPSGELHAEFTGHFGIVYDLSWSPDDQEVVTASSDGTSRCWDVRRCTRSSIKLYPHPSFVYSVKHHPKRPSILLTGGYDGAVRVWTKITDNIHGEMIKLMNAHSGFVNSICFNVEENNFFSADSNGVIVEWHAPSTVTKIKGVVKESNDAALVETWHKLRSIKLEELKETPISSMKMHPGGKKLLLHTKNSTLQMLDLRTIMITRKYHGCINFKDHLRSTLSDCGSFVFGSSEDGLVRVWNTETGDLVYTYKELAYTNSVSDVDFHPLDNYVVFCSFGAAHPIVVYHYDPQATVEISVVSQRHKSQNMTDTVFADGMSTLDSATKKYTRPISSSAENLKTRLLEQLNTPVPTAATRMDSKNLPKATRSRRGTTPDRTLDTVGLTRSTWGSDFSAYPDSITTPMDISKGYIPSTSPHAHQHLGASTRFHDMSPVPHGNVHGGKSVSQMQIDSTVTVLYEYPPNREDELWIKPGDEITVLHKEGTNWWFGRHPDGREGYFPVNYVAEITVDDKESKSKLTSKSTVKPGVTSHHSAVIGKDGDLKIISGPEEDGGVEQSAVQQRRRRIKRKERRKQSAAE